MIDSLKVEYLTSINMSYDQCVLNLSCKLADWFKKHNRIIVSYELKYNQVIRTFDNKTGDYKFFTSVIIIFKSILKTNYELPDISND